MTVNMEEVDRIILHSLRVIGCDIDDDVSGLAEFTTELIVSSVAQCIRIISPDTRVPHRLPPSMSARFRVGSALAEAVVALGYRGELGYQTFLYSNEAEIRRVYMFLIEKLPKETTHVEESKESHAVLHRAIAAELKKQLSQPWLPYGVHIPGTPRHEPQRQFTSCRLIAPSGQGDVMTKTPPEVARYYRDHLRSIDQQPSHPRDLATSLLEDLAVRQVHAQEEDSTARAAMASRMSTDEYLTRKRQRLKTRIEDCLKEDFKYSQEAASKEKLANLQSAETIPVKTKGSRFTNVERLQFKKDDNNVENSVIERSLTSEEEQRKAREAEVAGLQEELKSATDELDRVKSEVRQFTSGIRQLKEAIDAKEAENKQAESSFRLKKRTLDLLPDAENNLAKLQALVDQSSGRLVSLAQQWEAHRVPLEEEYRMLCERGKDHVTETQRRLTEITDMREKMKTAIQDTRAKEQLQKQLVSDYENMTKDINRSAYTRRIIEIVGNIKKQKLEIDKVLVDTRSVQKEINMVNGKLERTFAVTDELIFKDAKKDENVRRAYKYLAALHENCNLLISTLEETGVIMREIRDIEDQIEHESQNKVIANLEKITSDYKQIKLENSQLIAKLKQK